MKENENENDQNDICFSDNNQTEQLDISSNYINIYREILNSRKYLKINFNNNFDNININLSSYLSIIQMLQEYPESYIKFIFKEEKFFASNKVLNFSYNSKSTIKSNKDDSSFAHSSKKNILTEELIDIDIMKSNTFAGKNNNFLNLNNEENNDNNNNNKTEKTAEIEDKINKKIDEKLEYLCDNLKNQIYQKYLQPSINEIENSMKQNKKDIKKKNEKINRLGEKL